ncbi:tyrosine-type recombinase/integrase [Chloroflexota bacterium]
MKEEIDAFLSYLSTDKKFSENTIVAYKNDLFQFEDFIQNQDKIQHWSEVDRQLVLSYLSDLKKRGYALSTVARKTASVKSLFKFLADKALVHNVPTENLGSPRVKKRIPDLLSRDQVKELLKQPDKYGTPGAMRDKAMLELLYASGFRASELTSLNVEDLNVDDTSISCLVKGSKVRTITIPRDSVPSLHKYIEEARPHLASEKGEKALFLNRLGERLTRQGFWQIMKNYAKEAKLDTLVTPRVMRHSFAAHTLSKGADLHSLQQSLGHANVSTTQAYVQLASQRKSI